MQSTAKGEMQRTWKLLMEEIEGLRAERANAMGIGQIPFEVYEQVARRLAEGMAGLGRVRDRY